MNTPRLLEISQLIIIGIAIITILAIGTTFVELPVLASNLSNTTVHTNVTNTEPVILNVTMWPQEVVLTAGTTTNVSCIADVFDYNGIADMYNASAIFYFNASGQTGNLDNNFRYYADNSSCLSTQGASPTNYTVECKVPLQYYANNGSWNCLVTIFDAGGGPDPNIKINRSAFANITNNVSALLAIDVPTLLEYGNMTVTQTSGDKQLNITNYGNIPINISVRAYANDSTAPGQNLSFRCVAGNIPVAYQKYYVRSGVTYNTMTPVSNLSTMISNFTLPQRTNDTNIWDDKNSTYWKLQIPLSIYGDCNGTLQFAASYAN